MPDSRVAERRVVAFLDSIKEDASEIYLLGDVLDYWYEYRYVVPRGYVRFFGKLAELADAGVKITWIIGNHDIWIFDYIPTELGIEVVDGILDREVMGVRMLMAHGDGVWQGSRKFRLLRGLFRNKFCQHLFSAIHPRWTVPFAYSWSRHSRDNGGSDNVDGIEEAINRNLDALHRFCEKYESLHPDCRYFLFGHVHRLIDQPVGKDARMIVLGEWITLFSYAMFDGKKMSIGHFNGGDIAEKTP